MTPASRRVARDKVEHLVLGVTGHLDDLGAEWHVGGSWRRGCDEVGDLDVLVVDWPVDQLGLGDWFVWSRQGAMLGSGVVDDGIEFLQVDFWSCAPEDLGGFLWFITGPKELNIAMRAHALRRGMSLSQYGVTALEGGARLDDGTERGVADVLGWQWMEPPERQEWLARRRGGR